MRYRQYFSNVNRSAGHARVAQLRGFTITEMILVLTIAGVLSMIGFRSSRDAVRSTQLRSARVTTSNYVAIARAAAISRGCRSVFHVDQSAGSAWVTACRLTTVGGPGTAVDTLGRVDTLSRRYGVTIAATADSVQFDPRGLNATYIASTIRFTGATSAQKDSFVVNAVGRVVR